MFISFSRNKGNFTLKLICPFFTRCTMFLGNYDSQFKLISGAIDTIYSNNKIINISQIKSKKYSRGILVAIKDSLLNDNGKIEKTLFKRFFYLNFYDLENRDLTNCSLIPLKIR